MHLLCAPRCRLHGALPLSHPTPTRLLDPWAVVGAKQPVWWSVSVQAFLAVIKCPHFPPPPHTHTTHPCAGHRVSAAGGVGPARQCPDVLPVTRHPPHPVTPAGPHLGGRHRLPAGGAGGVDGTHGAGAGGCGVAGEGGRVRLVLVFMCVGSKCVWGGGGNRGSNSLCWWVCGVGRGGGSTAMVVHVTRAAAHLLTNLTAPCVLKSNNPL